MVKIERIAASLVRIWRIIAGSTATFHDTLLACLSRTIEITSMHDVCPVLLPSTLASLRAHANVNVNSNQQNGVNQGLHALRQSVTPAF